MNAIHHAVYYYGLSWLHDGDGWPSVARPAFPTGRCTQDEFDRWLGALAGEPKPRPGEDETLWRDRARIAVFLRYKVPAFTLLCVGHASSPVYAVAPEGAVHRCWRAERLPTWPAHRLTTWQEACTRLAEDLPGADAPGLHFGCAAG